MRAGGGIFFVTPNAWTAPGRGGGRGRQGRPGRVPRGAGQRRRRRHRRQLGRPVGRCAARHTHASHFPTDIHPKDMVLSVPFFVVHTKPNNRLFVVRHLKPIL